MSQFKSFLTPTESVYVIAHMGIAHVPIDGWELRIEGAVERPLRLTHAELLRRPAETIEGVLECFGNPVEPDVATRRVGNVSWRGARLWPLLEEAGVQPRASLAWLEAPDHGAFAGTSSERYIKDVPLEIVRERPVLLAWEMNGAPLTAEHGFPVRAVVPGFFGTNSVKWVSRVYLADTRPESLFTTRLYNRRVTSTGASGWSPCGTSTSIPSSSLPRRPTRSRPGRSPWKAGRGAQARSGGSRSASMGRHVAGGAPRAPAPGLCLAAFHPRVDAEVARRLRLECRATDEPGTHSAAHGTEPYPRSQRDGDVRRRAAQGEPQMTTASRPPAVPRPPSA